MVMTIIAKNEITTDSFMVNDSDGNVVTGLVNANFTKILFDPNDIDVWAIQGGTVNEIGNGLYEVTFTPDSIGNWRILIQHATYFPGYKSENYICQVGGILNSDDIEDAVLDADIDDHLGGNSVGGTIYSTKKVAGRGVNITGLWTKEEKDDLIDKLSLIEKIIKDLENTVDTKTVETPIIENNSTDLTPVLNKLSIEAQNTEKNNQKLIYYQTGIKSYLTGIKADIEKISDLLIQSCPDELLEETFDDIIQRENHNGNEKQNEQNKRTK